MSSSMESKVQQVFQETPVLGVSCSEEGERELLTDPCPQLWGGGGPRYSRNGRTDENANLEGKFPGRFLPELSSPLATVSLALLCAVQQVLVC